MDYSQMSDAELNAAVGAALDFEKSFRCPRCGSTHFGSSHVNSVVLHIECHDGKDRGCQWTGQWSDVPWRDYSTSIADAWLVAEHLCDGRFKSFRCHLVDVRPGNGVKPEWVKRRWYAAFSNGPCGTHAPMDHWGEADTAARAIVIAALSAVSTGKQES